MERFVDRTVWCLALVLGQASALWGMMITLGWAIGFVLIISSKGRMESMMQLRLSTVPPLIGLTVAGLALIVAQKSRTSISQYAMAGLVFNAIGLALALVLLSR